MAKGVGITGRIRAACGRAWRSLRIALEGTEGRTRRQSRRAERENRRLEINAEAEALKARIRGSGFRPCPEHARQVARQRLTLISLVLLAGCSSSLPPPARLACYFEADRDAQAAVDTLCPGQPFAACPAHDEIMAGLKSAQEACK